MWNLEMKWKYIIFIAIGIIIIGGIMTFNYTPIKEQIINFIEQAKEKGTLLYQEVWVGKVIINPFSYNNNLNNYKVEINNGLNVSYNDEYFITFIPYFVMNDGTIYKWNDIPVSIKKELWKVQITDNQYKYGVNFNNISSTIKNNLKYVVLHRDDSYGLTCEGIQIEGNEIIIKNLNND